MKCISKSVFTLKYNGATKDGTMQTYLIASYNLCTNRNFVIFVSPKGLIVRKLLPLDNRDRHYLTRCQRVF